MAYKLKETTNLPIDDSDFDILLWIRRIATHWYLFLLGMIIALVFALAENRKWIPEYYSVGTMIIKETSGYGNNTSLMNGFGIDAGLKNVFNQQIMLNSYDLISRVIDSLPYLNVEYITQGRFRTRNIYTNSPITIKPLSTENTLYNTLFLIQFFAKDSVDICLADKIEGKHILGTINHPIKSDWFNITIQPNPPHYYDIGDKLYFKFRSKEDLTFEFLNRLQIGFAREGSTILSIALVSSTPNRDIDFINKLCQIALLHNLEQKNEVAENTIKFIDQQILTLKNALGTSENEITNFRKNNNFINVNSYGNQLMAALDSYNNKKRDIDLQQTYINYLSTYINENMNNNAIIMPSSFGINENNLLNLIQQFNTARLKQNELSDKNPFFYKYEQDMQNIKDAIYEYIRSIQNSLNIQKKELEKQSLEISKKVKQLPSQELQLTAIERNYRIDDNYYTFFLQKRAEAEIQRASNLPDNSILDKARTTRLTNGKVKNKNLFLAIVLGFLIPLVLAILLELINNKIRSEQDLKQIYHAPLLGTLHHLSTIEPLLVQKKPRSVYAENLRSIKSKIEFIAHRKENLTITVTSAESGDGKTLFSTHIAAIYSMTGEKTILLDLDLRKPNIHTQLNFEKGQGITDYFIGECQLENITIHYTQNFDILRAGTIPPNPAELLNSNQLHQLINLLKEKYKYIIIDTSPIGIVSDATDLIHIADVCVFVVRCMKTNKYMLKQTLEQISQITIQNNKTHIVLTDVPRKRLQQYGKYGKYGYGNNAKDYYCDE